MVLSEFTGARAHKNDNLSRVRQEVRPLRPLGFNGNIANTEMSNMYSYILFLFYFLQISQQEMEENTKVCTF